MPELKGTQTEKNLLMAFAGESQARNRYTYFASKAKKEGLVQISKIFQETADQEKEHAKRFFKFLEGGDLEVTATFPAGVIGTTLENLLAAAAGEKHEHTDLYPSFAATAREEGFEVVAQAFDAISIAERQHEKRYRDLASNIENGLVFKRGDVTIWRCLNCGYLHEGEEAPDTCPACIHPRDHFELLGENYWELPVYERIHEEAFAVEQVHFKKTKKRTNPKKADPFMVLGGDIPVLVSSPHSVRQVRDGKIKRSDENTGSLAFLLNRETRCHAITVKKLYGGDPNWDEKCIFKERLRELVKANGIRLVLDLHGAARQSDFDVDLGTMHGESLLGNTNILPTLKSSFHAEGIDKVTENIFPADMPHTVTRFCFEELGVTAVQLEINHRYRAPNRNGADYAKLFRALVSFIEKTSSNQPSIRLNS